MIKLAIYVMFCKNKRGKFLAALVFIKDRCQPMPLEPVVAPRPSRNGSNGIAPASEVTSSASHPVEELG